jgi:hypothetical protein
LVVELGDLIWGKNSWGEMCYLLFFKTYLLVECMGFFVCGWEYL